MYDRLAQPLLSGISAGDGARLSMATMFPQLRALEREHCGLVRGMIAARKKRATGPTTGSPSPFVSFPMGLSELVDGVVCAVNARDPDGGRIALRTHAVVSGIVIAGTGTWDAASGKREAHGFTIQLSTGEVVAADAIVLATPAYTAATLLAPIHRELSLRLSEIEYGSVATVSLAYPLAAVPRTLDATGYVVPQRAGRPVLACTWASAKFDDRAPRDRALFRVFVGGALRAAFENASDAELRELAIREMIDVMGIRAEPLVCRVNRFTRAMPQYHVGHQSRVSTIQSLAAQVPGLHLAGAAYGGVGIPDCIRSGERAAAAVLTDLDAHASSLIPSPT
jgi:oxygen-dependent protoporphyrinogen oxidase